jgi:hypothetical protein
MEKETRETMSVEEFDKQEKYCRENNVPGGIGCEGCSGKDSVCADNIRGIMKEILPVKYFLIKKEFKGYDITIRMWSYAYKDLENELEDDLIIVDEVRLFEKLTELAS